MKRSQPRVKKLRIFFYGIAVFSTIFLASCSSPSVPAQMEKGPYLLLTGDSASMTVQWQTQQTPWQSTIEWGPTEKYGRKSVVTESNSNDYGHQFSYPITDLSPATQIFYRVTVDGVMYTGSFRTAPAASATDLSFYAYGDTRSQPAVHDQVVRQVMADLAQLPSVRQTFILHVGDFVHYGMEESYWDQEYFDRQYTDTLNFQANLPILSIIGNHETYYKTTEDLEEVSDTVNPEWGRLLKKYWLYNFFAQPNHFYYSFDYGPVHVATIDEYTADLTAGGAQAQWLEADLKNTDKRWKIVMFHEPAYGPAMSPRGQTVRANFCPIFEKYGVKAVVQGHSHFYARQEVNGIQYFVVGGGGAPLDSPGPGYISEYMFSRFDIVGDTLTVTVINIDGQTIDTVTIK